MWPSKTLNPKRQLIPVQNIHQDKLEQTSLSSDYGGDPENKHNPYDFALDPPSLTM